jgi:hypothetical protein
MQYSHLKSSQQTKQTLVSDDEQLKPFEQLGSVLQHLSAL